jgi:hypothetical protein
MALRPPAWRRPAGILLEQFGLTADNVYARAKALMAKGA